MDLLEYPPENAYQALMRRWTSLGPYNALHLLGLKGPPPMDRWGAAIAEAVAPLGIKIPVAIETHEGLEWGITRELNMPFEEWHQSLRFFVILNRKGNHYLGITFDHWVADSQSIRSLMRRIYSHFKSPGAAGDLPPMRLNAVPFEQLFGTASFTTSLSTTVRNFVRHRQARRFVIHAPMDFSVGFQFNRLPDGLIGRVRQYGKKLGATVNDVFLAAAVITLGAHAVSHNGKIPARGPADIAAAIDMRPFSQNLTDETFGFFLGYFNVLVDGLDTDDFPGIVAQIAAKTRLAKDREHVLRLFQGFKFANLYWDLHKLPWKRAMMFHRTMRTLGGISNVNLVEPWITGDPCLLDYIRVSPTGPIVPIVFTLTTINDRLTLSTTYRNGVFTSGQAAKIISDFVERLLKI